MAENDTEKKAILCVCLNPVIQKTLVFDGLVKDHVNRTASHRIDAAGKGVNVARVLTQTGSRAVHLTQAGGPDRDWFLELCARDGLDVRWVESGAEVRFCHTLIDRADGTTTELVEEARPVRPGTGGLVLEEFARLLPECRALVISGTRAEGFPDSIYPDMTRMAREAGLLVVLDIKGRDLLTCLPQRPIIVKPNLHELLATWPAPAGTSGEAAERGHVAALAAGIEAEYGARLVVTRGARPAWYFDDGDLREESAIPVKALNPTGSGDSFTAGLTAVLADGGTLREAVKEGARLGALNAATLIPGWVL